MKIRKHCAMQQIIALKQTTLETSQKFVSGLGNIYVNEVIFLSELNPKTRGRSRRGSMPNMQNIKMHKSPPKPSINHRERRMSEPLTDKEKIYAHNDSELKKQYQQSQEKIKNELLHKNMDKYDKSLY